MMRIKLILSASRRPVSWQGLLLAGLLLFVAAQPQLSAAAQPRPTADFLPESGGRHYYLTDANFATDAALTACSAGYHMAALWEILDPSNLIYDYDHPDAHTKEDSGFGPPSGWYGWVRTGTNSSGSSTTGAGNCLAWTSADGADNGVAVRLSRTWETDPGDIGPWQATSFSCSLVGPVWCVGDFSGVYLPMAVKK